MLNLGKAASYEASVNTRVASLDLVSTVGISSDEFWLAVKSKNEASMNTWVSHGSRNRACLNR